MPIVTIPADATNKNLYTLVDAAEAGPLTGWVTGQVRNPTASSDSVKIGRSNMTSSLYDLLLEPSDSAPLSQGEPVMLQTLYARNDGAVAVDLELNIRNT